MRGVDSNIAAIYRYVFKIGCSVSIFGEIKDEECKIAIHQGPLLPDAIFGIVILRPEEE